MQNVILKSMQMQMHFSIMKINAINKNTFELM